MKHYEENTNMATRQGKHKKGKTFLGAYVEPEIKVLATMTSDALGESITDIILNGLWNEAHRAGISTERGVINPEHIAAYNAGVEILKAKLGVK